MVASTLEVPMVCRGIRGATTAERNSQEAILEATKELYLAVLERNGIAPDDIGAVLVTATPDLDATFPARAIRELGHVHVPLTCAVEMAVPNSLPLCVRLLLLVNTEKSAQEVSHVYLREAVRLRPDLVKAAP